MSEIRIGTRGSDLALWQARHVAARLEAAGRRTEIVVLKTRGDLIDDVPLTKVEGKAFFTAEIERALLEERVDLAVHSHKDLATEAPEGLVIGAVPERASAIERLLIAPAAHDGAGVFLPLLFGARVGTSAPRRAEQLQTLRPDLTVLDLRGNVPTRVKRLREGRYDAVVLAGAGLDRLELDTSDLVDVALDPSLLVPAPAQGALAIQVREKDAELRELCREHLDAGETASVVAAERELLALAGGGCNLPLGANVEHEAGVWRARTFLGAGHPTGAEHARSRARWAEATGPDPGSAMRSAYRQLTSGEPTLSGPLAGLRVALTGSASAGTLTGERLTSLGAEVLHERVLEFEDVACPELDHRLAALAPGDWVAVTSQRAAAHLAGKRLPAGVSVAAVGPATARALAQTNLTADLTGPGGAKELATRLQLSPGARVLFPCAAEARDDLAMELEPRGHAVERLTLYATRACDGIELEPEADVRVYMSPSAVRAARPWEDAHPGRATRRVALGHASMEALIDAGLEATKAPRVADLGDEAGAPEALIRQLVSSAGDTKAIHEGGLR